MKTLNIRVESKGYYKHDFLMFNLLLNKMITRITGLRTPFYDRSSDLFFSLVCYRNNLFISNAEERIIEFYNGFKNRDELFKWMEQRPKGVSEIHEVEGRRDIIVVIPTADFDGKYAVECRNNIFKGLHMIFVESFGNNNPYFNYSHNCNLGIKMALKYNPKWVIVSNDDMKKIDDIETLISALLKLNHEDTNVVFTNKSPNNYHSKPIYFGKANILGKTYLFISRLMKKSNRLFFSYVYIGNNLIEKFKLKIFIVPKLFISKIFFSYCKTAHLTMSFAIFSGNFLRNRQSNLFNETFINGCEDWDLSYRIFYEYGKCRFVDYLIGEYVGGTIGGGNLRSLRDLTNIAFFNFSYEQYFR